MAKKQTGDRLLRNRLVELLKGRGAHMPLEAAVKDFPMDRINEEPPQVSYSCWHLVEHIRRTQKDILDYVVDENYEEMKWPDDYWPAQDMEADEQMWKETLQGYEDDLAVLIKLVEDEQTDLWAPVMNDPNKQHTLVREVLIVADHTAYHTGELGILRQVMGTWPEERDG